MAEHFFDTYSDRLARPADEREAGETAHPVRDAGDPTNERSTARRRPRARKREPRVETPEAAKARREREERAALEAQGFTADEAARLLKVEDPNEAVMRRLRFQRWLIEHGLLDEFSA